MANFTRIRTHESQKLVKNEKKFFWTWGDSIWGPLACKSNALPLRHQVDIINGAIFDKLIVWSTLWYHNPFKFLLKKKDGDTKEKCIFCNILSLNLRFFFFKTLIIPYRMTANCQKSLRIKIDEKLILTSVMFNM